MTIDTTPFTKLLETELAELEAQLETVGRKNPANPKIWEAVEGEADVDRADETEVADAIEQYESNSGVLDQLVARRTEVKAALEKIENGKYGICETCGMEIEDDRLIANPAAKTCKLHMVN